MTVRYFLVDFAKVLSISFLQNTSRRLLLKITDQKLKGIFSVAFPILLKSCFYHYWYHPRLWKSIQVLLVCTMTYLEILKPHEKILAPNFGIPFSPWICIEVGQCLWISTTLKIKKYKFIMHLCISQCLKTASKFIWCYYKSWF